MIKVENLVKIFRTEDIETLALNGVSFEINDGEFVAIMGPSGSSVSPLPALWSPTRSSSSPTSLPVTSTQKTAAR